MLGVTSGLLAVPDLAARGSTVQSRRQPRVDCSLLGFEPEAGGGVLLGAHADVADRARRWHAAHVTRQERFGWTALLVVGVVISVLSLTLGDGQPWEHYTGALGAVMTGSGLGQLIRGWWRARHAHTAHFTEDGK